jgi:FKBP-type peptidyl-prolyl cis-trans isomerase (trigger factor)
MAQEIAKEKEAQEKLAKERGGMISINDLDSGTGEKIIGCNDEVEFSYVIQTKDGKEVNSIKKPQKTIIGSKQEKTIERNIIGMKEGGIRSINVPFGSQTDDKKLDTLLKLNGQDLQYLVTVSKIKKSKNPPSSCF